jgi:hypothetical protein
MTTAIAPLSRRQLSSQEQRNFRFRKMVSLFKTISFLNRIGFSDRTCSSSIAIASTNFGEISHGRK